MAAAAADRPDPYRVALLVHLSSAAAYTVVFWLRAPMLGETRYVRFGRRATAALAVVLLVLAGLAGLGAAREEPSLPWADRQPSAFDARFMRGMAAHHQVGVDLARLPPSAATWRSCGCSAG